MQTIKIKTNKTNSVYVKKSEIEYVNIMAVKEKMDCGGIIEECNFFQADIHLKSGKMISDFTYYAEEKEIIDLYF